MQLVYKIALVVHIYSAVVLVGSMFFNTLILQPSLARIPPAHSATIADKVGAALGIAGPVSLVLLGVTGFLRLSSLKLLGGFFSIEFFRTLSHWWIWLMFGSWFLLVITGTLSAVWYQRVLSRKLPYTAGLRELEERRAAQERISAWQDRMNYVNLTLGVLALLGASLWALS